jgi:hypothetical protein
MSPLHHCFHLSFYIATRLWNFPELAVESGEPLMPAAAFLLAVAPAFQSLHYCPSDFSWVFIEPRNMAGKFIHDVQSCGCALHPEVYSAYAEPRSTVAIQITDFGG